MRLPLGLLLEEGAGILTRAQALAWRDRWIEEIQILPAGELMAVGEALRPEILYVDLAGINTYETVLRISDEKDLPVVLGYRGKATEGLPAVSGDREKVEELSAVPAGREKPECLSVISGGESKTEGLSAAFRYGNEPKQTQGVLYLSVPEGTELLPIMNRMQELFREFSAWNLELYDACAQSLGLAELLIRTENVTVNHIYIADMSFKVLAYTQLEIMTNTSATWRYQLVHGYLPVHVMKNMIADGEFERLNGYQQADHVYSANFNVPFVTKNIFYNGKPQAHLFVVNMVNRPSCRDIAVAQILGEFIENHFFLLSELKLNRIGSTHEAFFNDVLSGGCQDESLIQKQLTLFDWSLDGGYCMAVADITNRDENFCRMLMYQIESDSQRRCFVRQQTLVVMEAHMPERYPAFQRAMQEISARYRLEICMGNCFKGFLHMRDQYQIQTKIMELAGRLPEKKLYYHTGDFSLRYIIDYVSRNESLGQLCSPDAILLKKQDEENRTDYFETYYTYLMCERNVVRTAAELHIHRNTLMYRLEKIHQCLTFDENEKEQRLHMLMSMLLLRHRLHEPF